MQRGYRRSSSLKFSTYDDAKKKRWRKDDRTTGEGEEKKIRREKWERDREEEEEERKRAKEEVDYLRTDRVAKKESNSSFRYDRQDTTSGSSIYLLLYCLIGRYYRRLHTYIVIDRDVELSFSFVIIHE